MKLDVAIIGAGPSGAWAAYLLASRGARVLLFDPSHPREKPCGGGVTGRALQIVGDALAVSDLPTVPISTARFIDTSVSTAAARSSVVPLPTGALAVASRTAFDGALLASARRAGANVAAARVRHIERHGGAWTITTTDAVHTASRLIGADGANSLTRRSLAKAFGREQLSIATGFFAHGVTSNEVVIELASDPPGYLWSFPRPDHLAIGICAQADAGVASGVLRAQAGRWMQRVGLAAGAQLDAYSWPIPSLSGEDFDTLDVSGDDWYLVGDAAGLVDPITREGIYFALQSAQYVAEALLADSPRVSQAYTDRVRSEIVADLACAARLKASFFRPDFTRLLMSALTQSERVRSIMADLVAGTQSYRHLKWRLAATMEWKLAWQVLRGTGMSGPYSRR